MENLTIKQKLELKKLRDLNVSKVEISYSGGGDDGCIDNWGVYTIDSNGKEKWNRDIIINSFSEAFDDYVYNLLSNVIEWDWVNNEGGYGCLTLDIENEEIKIDHSQRHVEEYHYSDNQSQLLKNFSKEIKDGSPVTA
jgi:hypothetical protein|tara:strand:- start:80 stop:493 length:414 start_codon:yes stop_codon:yes gene_type:complete